MNNLGRLLLRLVLVPLGYAVAVVVGTLVIVFGSWKLTCHPGLKSKCTRTRRT